MAGSKHSGTELERKPSPPISVKIAEAKLATTSTNTDVTHCKNISIETSDKMVQTNTVHIVESSKGTHSIGFLCKDNQCNSESELRVTNVERSPHLPHIIKLTKMNWLNELSNSTPGASLSPESLSSTAIHSDISEHDIGIKCLSTVLKLDKEHNMFGLSNYGDIILKRPNKQMPKMSDGKPVFHQTTIIHACCTFKCGPNKCCKHVSKSDLPSSLKIGPPCRLCCSPCPTGPPCGKPCLFTCGPEPCGRPCSRKCSRACWPRPCSQPCLLPPLPRPCPRPLRRQCPPKPCSKRCYVPCPPSSCCPPFPCGKPGPPSPPGPCPRPCPPKPCSRSCSRCPRICSKPCLRPCPPKPPCRKRPPRPCSSPCSRTCSQPKCCNIPPCRPPKCGRPSVCKLCPPCSPCAPCNFGMKVTERKTFVYEPSPVEIIPRAPCLMSKPMMARPCNHCPPCLPPSGCYPYLMPCYLPARPGAPCTEPGRCFHTPRCPAPRVPFDPNNSDGDNTSPCAKPCEKSESMRPIDPKKKCAVTICPGNNPELADAMRKVYGSTGPKGKDSQKK